jgi:Ca-activated chloride channel homolog
VKRRLIRECSLAVLVAGTAIACMAQMDSQAQNASKEYRDTNEGDDSIDDDPPLTHETAQNKLTDDIPDAALMCDTVNDSVFTLYPGKPDALFAPPLARAIIDAGARVDFPIRTVEFLSYYCGAAQSPDDSAAITLDAEQDTDPSQYQVMMTLSTTAIETAKRPPLNLTLSIDTSESMGSETFALVKDVSRILLDRLTGRDTLSVTTWNQDQPVLLDTMPVDSGNASETLTQALGEIEIGGASDIGFGIDTAYTVAFKNAVSGSRNRIVALSDGGAELGVTTKDFIATEANRQEPSAIRLLALGVAADPLDYHMLTMRTLSEAGRGAHVFVDSAAEARRVLGEDLTPFTDIAATDIVATLTLPPAFELSGTPSTGANLVSLGPASDLVMTYTATVCDESVITTDREIQASVSYTVPSTGEPRVVRARAVLDKLLSEATDRELKRTAVVAYAKALGALRTLSAEQARSRIDATLETVDKSLSALRDDGDLKEIASLLETYRSFFK